ncbi:UDP-glucose:glycoprotein glucosyltransferase-domain-containing protein [Phycomyces nitens]|nr:UDP-glucose:glycoprotein glucosyltransferase-domain-containing protein [Phycomyces nitens]
MKGTARGVLSLALISTYCLAALANSPPVELTLVAPWSAPHLSIEIAETVSMENETTYFSFVSDLLHHSDSSPRTPQKLYEDYIKTVQDNGHASYPEGIESIKLSLSLHLASPRVEAHHQLYTNSVLPLLSEYDKTCKVWAQAGGVQVCDLAKLEEAIKAMDQTDTKSVVFPFDHILHPSHPSDQGTPVVFVYTSEFSPSFGKFHAFMTNAVDKYGVSYVVRYKPSSSPGTPLYLTGYGVELALKNTDYLVIDDKAVQENKQKTFINKVSSFGRKVGNSLFETSKTSIAPLVSEEIGALGLKAGRFIATAENPLEALIQLSQDFPKYAKSVSQVELDDEYVHEIKENQASMIRGGTNAIWFNGQGVEVEQVDPFYLVRVLKRERELIDSLKLLGLTSRQSIDLVSSHALSHEDVHDTNSPKDIYDVREQGLALWWNDIENEARYEGWSENLFDLLKPTYPGQLRTIRKNIYNLLMVDNLSSHAALTRMKNEVLEMVKRGTPIRFGLLPVVGDEDSPATVAAKAVNYIAREYGTNQAMDFLSKLADMVEVEQELEASLSIIESAFAQTIVNEGKPKSKQIKSFVEVLNDEQDYIKELSGFLRKMGIAKDSEGAMFLNGKFLEYSNDMPWTRTLMQGLQEQTQLITNAIYYGLIKPKENIYSYLLTQSYVAGSRNPYIAPSESHPLKVLPVYKEFEAFKSLHYLQNNDESVINTNLWIVANLDTFQGLKLALEALSFVETNNQTRVSLIHNPEGSGYSNVLSETKKSDKPVFSDVWYSQIYGRITEIPRIKELLLAAIQSAEEEKSAKLINQVKAFSPGASIVRMFSREKAKDVKYICDVLKHLGMQSDFTGAVINGRTVGPFPLDVEFTADDFTALYSFEFNNRVEPIKNALESVEKNIESNLLADTITLVNSILEADKATMTTDVFDQGQPTSRQRPYDYLNGNKTSFSVGDPSTAFIEIGVTLDPLSEAAQKWSHLLETLSGLSGVYIKIYMNPETEVKEVPLKQFYRQVFDREPHFDKAGEIEVPMAFFAGLPTDPLYTLRVDTIKSWHVTVKEANMDLDNIQLTFLGAHQPSVSAVYELEHILLEGHCMDASTHGPPRGLQFVLGTPSNPVTTDTIVMANLGYFQLKALPGVWRLGLREGPSNDMYHIESVGTHGKWEKSGSLSHGTNSDYTLLPLTSFEGLTVFPQVKHNEGVDPNQVLDHASSSGHGTEKKKQGIWSSLTNKIFGDSSKTNESDQLSSQPKQADINIFSVASGQLYERFLSIMIISVMEHTQSTVKFWFIEDFLSPSFKDFLPELAKEYKFDYEMVTYKWPSWLRSQKEKQRTIWGYKILFLDVLFPLSLDKVIFVDADQIVRADMKELVDMDLHGAPYGYTPFCSDRTEMDGFRFWTQGYWKEHLKERPYHISALYVVDLVQFRRMAAGDRLRAQYQQLSADPHSLANLDQDLPNNMQHIVPIHSLPQEWLWCETWCSDESLKTAKTIDLCNNPLTKEPKLDRARRQLPEWEVYDNQVSQLKKKVAARLSSESSSMSRTPVITTATTSSQSSAKHSSAGIIHQVFDGVVGGGFEDVIDVLEDTQRANTDKHDEL